MVFVAMRCSALFLGALAILGHARRLHRNDADDIREALPSLTSLLTQGPATGFNAGAQAPKKAKAFAAATPFAASLLKPEKAFAGIADSIDTGKYGAPAAAKVEAVKATKATKAVKVTKAAAVKATPAVKAAAVEKAAPAVKVAAVKATKAATASKAATVAKAAAVAAAATAVAEPVAPVREAIKYSAPAISVSAPDLAPAGEALSSLSPIFAGALGLSTAAVFLTATGLIDELYKEEETEYDYVDPKVIGTPEDPIAQFNADRKPGPVGPGNRQAGEIVFGKQGAAFVKPGFRRKRPVSPIRVVEAFGVLDLIAEQGLLSKLEKEKVFSQIEPLLPLLDKYQLLSLAERFLQKEASIVSNLGLSLIAFAVSFVLAVPDDNVALVLLQVVLGLVGVAGGAAAVVTAGILDTIQKKKGVRWGQGRKIR